MPLDASPCSNIAKEGLQSVFFELLDVFHALHINIEQTVFPTGLHVAPGGPTRAMQAPMNLGMLYKVISFPDLLEHPFLAQIGE